MFCSEALLGGGLSRMEDGQLICVVLVPYGGLPADLPAELVGWCHVVWIFVGCMFKQTWLKNHESSNLSCLESNYSQCHWWCLILEVLNILSCNFFNISLHYFLKLFCEFLKIVYCCRTIFFSSKATYQQHLTITIFIFSANCYLNKTRLKSSNNIYQTIDLIELINANLEKVITYNLLQYFTVFYSKLLRIILCVFDKFLELWQIVSFVWLLCKRFL